MIRTAADVRAEIARLRLHRYQLAGLIGIAPSRLSHVLNEPVALTPELRDRIVQVLDYEQRRQAVGAR